MPLGPDYSTDGSAAAADLRFSYNVGLIEEQGGLGSRAVENENIGYPECGCSCGAVLGRPPHRIIKDEMYVCT